MSVSIRAYYELKQKYERQLPKIGELEAECLDRYKHMEDYKHQVNALKAELAVRDKALELMCEHFSLGHTCIGCGINCTGFDKGKWEPCPHIKKPHLQRKLEYVLNQAKQLIKEGKDECRTNIYRVSIESQKEKNNEG